MDSNWKVPAISDPGTLHETIPNAKPKIPLLCTITELATLLQVPVKTIYFWVYRKQIPFIKMGRHLRFKPEEVIKSFIDTTSEESTPCFARPVIIKKSGNRSLKFRDADPASTKE